MLVGVCVAALCAVVGILRRRVWGAYGFALLLALSILLMLFFAVTGQTSGSFLQTLIAIVLYTLIGCLYVLAGLTLKVEGAKMGSPIPWIIIIVVLFAPFTIFRTVNVPDDSMKDSLLLGDSLLINRFSPSHYSAGEIVAFQSPQDHTQIGVARIVAPQPDGYELKGDAPGSPKVVVNASQIIGKPALILDSLSVDPADAKSKELTHPLVHRWERVFKPL
jgi:hypothetical protein